MDNMVTFKKRFNAVLEAAKLSLGGMLVYVIYNNSSGLYIVDTYYGQYSDEKLISVYFNGEQQ